MKNRGLTEDQKDFIRNNYLKMSSREIGNEIGSSKGMVLRYLRQVGLKAPESRYRKWAVKDRKRIFTDQELTYIHQNYDKMNTKELAAKLKASSNTIGKLLKTLGYGDFIRQRTLDSRIKPGTIPPNKGKKMSPELKKRIAHTFFQKGNQPHNTLKVGDRRVNSYGYMEEKIAEPNKWGFVHRMMWEEANGNVPNGHIIVFKDGDKMNISLENLECISRKENMDRNTIHNYPDAIKENIRLTKKLQRKINTKLNEK